MDRPADKSFVRELRERFPHLTLEWIQLGWFGSAVVNERYVLWETDLNGTRQAYMIVQSPKGEFREPGSWLFPILLHDSRHTRALYPRFARRKFLQSLGSKYKEDLLRLKRRAAIKERWKKGDMRDKALFAAEAKLVIGAGKRPRHSTRDLPPAGGS